MHPFRIGWQAIIYPLALTEPRGIVGSILPTHPDHSQVRRPLIPVRFVKRPTSVVGDARGILRLADVSLHEKNWPTKLELELRRRNGPALLQYISRGVIGYPPRRDLDEGVIGGCQHRGGNQRR